MSSLRFFEYSLPYLVLLPFGYFLGQSYKHARREVIHDSKNGKIKREFIQSWLKTVALDQVILKEPSLRSKSLWFLEELVKEPEFQTDALQMWLNAIHKPDCIEEGKDICFVLCREIMTKDASFKRGFKDAFTYMPYSINWIEEINRFLLPDAPKVGSEQLLLNN